MKISILAPTEQHPALQAIINTEERLHELVGIHDVANFAGAVPLSAATLLVQGGFMHLPADWYNLLPPIRYATNIPFERDSLLGVIFARLSNYEKAFTYLQQYPELLFCTSIISRLQQGAVFSDALAADLSAASNNGSATALHNLAVCGHYSHWETAPPFETIAGCYEQALIAAPDAADAAFTVKHYATLLADTGLLADAERLLQEWLDRPLPPDARHGLQITLCSVWMSRLQVPYDMELLEKLKQMLWSSLQYLEETGRNTEAALLLTDAAHVANICNSFSESLGYISRAIKILQDAEEPELTANAQFKKGMLLYTWAQSGQPQFYRGAMEALLAALEVFRRDSAPDVFADIHHYLGIIYSEIPDEVKKKSIWAGVSYASFNEALSFYNKVDYPYEFAMICHHFGNAFTRYPAALHSDNYDKAMAWYREALDVRTAAAYPVERCHTLYNYLQAAWQVSYNGEELPQTAWQDIHDRATELQQLTTDADMRQEAAGHLEQLAQIKAAATA